MSDYQERVRIAAYYLWEAEGRPNGRAEVHWQMGEIATALLTYLSQDKSPEISKILNQAQLSPHGRRPSAGVQRVNETGLG